MTRTATLRKFLPLLALALYLLGMSSAIAAISLVPSPPSIAAESYILMDFQSGKVLARKNFDERIPPASMTKMMTAYIVFHELESGQIHLDDQVTISKTAWKTGGSSMFLEVGTQATVHQLLHGMLVASGNDAAVALAEYVGGTGKTFVHYMNHFAAKLGMKNTHFDNPDGLPDPDHYSTAHDLAILARALVRKYPEYLHFFSEKEFTWGGIKQYNRNELLWRDPSVDGLKTGHTKAAGYCLAATAKRDGMRLISVVTHTDSNDARARTSEALLNYGFRFFKTRRIASSDKTLDNLRVWKGTKDHLTVGVLKDYYVTVPSSAAKNLTIHLQTRDRVIAPVKAGQKMGTLQVKHNGKIIGHTPVYALTTIKAGSWFKQIWDSIVLFFTNLI